ncbi:hypothetical protein MRX96_000907 [Rhipicephalus microplus]
MSSSQKSDFISNAYHFLAMFGTFFVDSIRAIAGPFECLPVYQLATKDEPEPKVAHFTDCFHLKKSIYYCCVQQKVKNSVPRLLRSSIHRVCVPSLVKLVDSAHPDKYKAILPITLVKAFKPKGEEDFERNKKVQAYWKSEDENIQGYYPAFVHAFAGDFDTMRLKLKTLREPFPRTIDVDRHEVHPRKTEQNGQPKEPPHSVVEEQKTIIEKKDKEIKKLRKQLSEASSLNTRLTNVMLNKIVTAERQEGQVIAEFMLPSSLDAGTGLPVEMVEDVRDLDMDVEATCLLPSSGVSDFNASIGHDDNHFVHSHDSLSHCGERFVAKLLLLYERNDIAWYCKV